MMNNNSLQLYHKKFYYQIIVKYLLALFGFALVVSSCMPLPQLLYMGALVFYLIITVIFLRNIQFRKYSHILDFLLVLFILWDSSLDQYYLFAFLLFPLVSRGVYLDRFSHDKYFVIEYILLVVALDFTVAYYGILYYVHQAIAVLMFSLLYVVSVQRMKYDERKIKMLDIADDYFIEQNKSYEVYGKVIDYLSGQGVDVDSITCFECDENYWKIHLVNSSYLVSNYRLKIGDNDKGRLSRGIPVGNVDFILDNTPTSKNIVFPIPQPNSSSRSLFLFVMVYQSKKSLQNEIDLEPLFLRMASLISFERIMREKRDATIQDMILKSKFVNGATNIMHFLKNRLTPLQTLADLAKDEGGVKQLEGYDEVLLETARSAQKEINAILNKAEFLLNKQNNPFVFSKEDCDAQVIFVTLSSIWDDLLSTEDEMEVSINTEEIYKYESNIEGLEILFSDIIGNMQKYSPTYRKCLFKQDENERLIIVFENDFSSKKDVTLLINDINNPNKDAVIYRTSYGVTNMRAISDNLSIGLKAGFVTEDDKELYQLELIFEPKKNEKDIDN